MSADDYGIEKLYKIWDSVTKEHIEIGPDGDGLFATEIRLCDRTNKVLARISMNKYQLALVIKALQEAYNDVKDDPEHD